MRAKGLIVGTGVIDLDFIRHELKLIVHNPAVKPSYYSDASGAVIAVYLIEDYYTIKKGDKIAQAMLCEHKSYLFGIESEDERIGGIGST